MASSLSEPEEKRDPKILVFDIETAPILAYVWSIWEQNVGLNQIESDWHLMSWAAKWLDKPEVMYMDQRGLGDISDDKNLMAGLWRLLDEADVVITQNGKAFDSKKVNSRFIIWGMTPPSPYKHIDTKQLAKKNFAFTSNKLEYLSEKLNKKHQKSKHKEFTGFDLWRECMKGNLRAWKEMEKYNKLDVLATEELYQKLSPWGGTGVDLNTFRGDAKFLCQCGSSDLHKRGFTYTKAGKYQQYQCKSCGSWIRDSGNLRNRISPKKKDSLNGL